MNYSFAARVVKLGKTNRDFVLGLSAGILVTWMLSTYASNDTMSYPSTKCYTGHSLQLRPSSSEGVPRGRCACEKEVPSEERKSPSFTSPVHHEVDDHLAVTLAENVRVLCWVSTHRDRHYIQAVVVKETWGKRCSKVLFISDVADSRLPSINFTGVLPGYEHLTAKTMHAFDYIYDHYMEDYDWFLKADDDTYVIMENLRFLLQQHDPVEALWFGAHLIKSKSSEYMSGGAGYVLSKAALRQFGERFAGMCRADGGSEDEMFGRCMSAVGVRFGNAHDLKGRTLFHVYDSPRHVATKDYLRWFFETDIDKGRGNVSDFPVSFHYVRPVDMYLLEYYVYHLRPFGIIPRIYTTS